MYVENIAETTKRCRMKTAIKLKAECNHMGNSLQQFRSPYENLLQLLISSTMSSLLFSSMVFSCLLISGFSFSPALVSNRMFAPIRMSSFSDIVKSKFAKAATIAVVANALVLSPMNVFTPVESAHADVRAQQKRTYFRFVPKLIIGRDFYKGAIKTAIDKEDWPVVTKFFEEFVSKYNPNDPSQVDSTGKIDCVNETIWSVAYNSRP